MNVPAHGHCEICQKPIEVGERFCGAAACEEKHEAAIKEKKRSIYILIAIIIAAVLLSKIL